MTLVTEAVPQDGDGVAVVGSGEGYQLRWGGVGEFTLDGEGRLASTRDPREQGRWSRVLVAQVLPLAAVLAGREVLHASCVSMEGAAVGFAGRSGVGKSTIAEHLVADGAAFLTDDVLALSVAATRPLAHPGASLIRLIPDDDDVPVDVSGKVAQEAPLAAEARPLGLLYVISRSEDVAELTLATGVGFKELMATTFNLLVQTPARLVRQLDLMAQMDACGVPVRALVPVGMGAEATARALGADARARLRRSRTGP